MPRARRSGARRRRRPQACPGAGARALRPAPRSRISAAPSRRAREARIEASRTAWRARLRPRNSRPVPLPTTTVLTRARRSRSSMSSTRTSRHEQASSSTAPSTPAAGRVGGCGSPSAAWLNSRMSSVRLTTPASVARRFRRVRVPRYGLITIRSSPHSTPIAAQFTPPSGLIVVTTVSMIGHAPMRTLLIDNYDSFTFNLFHLLGEVNGDEPIVVRNDELPWEDLAALPVDNIVISPGPGRPEHERDVGVSLDVLRRARVPVLGVCLGHQALAHVTGGAIGHAPEVMHGRLSPIHHDGRGLFAGIPQGFAAVRYHSLAVGACPAELRVTAWTPDGVVMGLEHRTRPRWGVQFHPESISTEHGHTLARNFRDLPRAQGHPSARAPRPARRPTAGARVHHRRLRAWCDPEAAFVALYGDREHAVWLDSSRAEPGLARFSFMGAPDGPLGQVVRYGVAERALTIERASGREELRESVLDYCERELERLRADAPELPFDFTCGFAGYLGYELKAECGGELVHRSSLPDAALVFCDRLIAFDHELRTVHLVALADAAVAAAAGGRVGGPPPRG